MSKFLSYRMLCDYDHYIIACLMSHSRASGASLLIAGTAIGAGMLALPAQMASIGFLPSIAANGIIALLMLCTGLLLVEALGWVDEEANFLSLADHFLGQKAKWVVGFFYLFLYYTLLMAYLSGGTLAVQQVVTGPDHVVNGWIALLFTVVMGAIVYLGTRFVDRINSSLMAFLGIFFVLLVILGIRLSDVERLRDQHWSTLWTTWPILMGAYGFHNILPTLSTYLREDQKKLRQSIIWGTMIPFIIYVSWQAIVLLVTPKTQLIQAYEIGLPITNLWSRVTGSLWFETIGLAFGFCALVTSLLGVGLAMVDFIGDGLHKAIDIHKKRWLLLLCTFVPPLVAVLLGGLGLFQKALGYAGGYGETILNGLFPIALVWVGRYHLKLDSSWRLPGGKATLLLLTTLILAIVGVESYELWGSGESSEVSTVAEERGGSTDSVVMLSKEGQESCARTS